MEMRTRAGRAPSRSTGNWTCTERMDAPTPALGRPGGTRQCSRIRTDDTISRPRSSATWMHAGSKRRAGGSGSPRFTISCRAAPTRETSVTQVDGASGARPISAPTLGSTRLPAVPTRNVRRSTRANLSRSDCGAFGRPHRCPALMTTLRQFAGDPDGEGVALSPDHAYTTTERCPAAPAGFDHRSDRPARVRALPRARRTARARCRRLAPRGAGHHRRDQCAGGPVAIAEPLIAGQDPLTPAVLLRRMNYRPRTSRILCPSDSDVNGLWMNAIPGSRTPWCTMASSVYPDM